VLVAIAQLCVEAGVPAGVLNVLYGNPAMISKAVIQAPQIRHLSFTGSVPVGRELAALAGRELKQITLELGGHSAAIIDRDVALDTVVELSVAAKFRNAGQICHAPARFLVHESVCDEFVARFAARANALRVGNGLREDVQMGPLIHERRQAAMRRMTQDAVAGGAQLVCGGEALAEAGGGSFWRPTVLLNAAPDSLAMTEEIFGPVALVMPYKDIDEAIALANGTRYGLAAYAFTNSANHMHLLQQELHAGSVAFNTYAVSCAELPFSGWGDSGVGSESGPEGLMAYLHTKSVIKAF
jgi:succinate-semialdehyde dehydrogenase/glutarate-semialdehyde dehydrogenase